MGTILSSLPAGFNTPVIIIQHVPTQCFSESLSEHFNEISELEVKIAEDDEIIRPCHIYLAPAGFQVTLKLLRDKNVIFHLTHERSDILGPSIDITMISAAKIYGKNITGVILSGMGCDGVKGSRAIKEASGHVIVQDESSLIFGMPKEIINAGYADEVLPVSGIVRKLLKDDRQHISNN